MIEIKLRNCSTKKIGEEDFVLRGLNDEVILFPDEDEMRKISRGYSILIDSKTISLNEIDYISRNGKILYQNSS